MRVPYVVLMILVILVANADTVAALTRSKQTTTLETTPSLLSLLRLLAGVPTERRLLRTTDVVTDEKADSEERVNIPGLSRIQSILLFPLQHGLSNARMTRHLADEW
ncbi:hypothetical protein PRNP1_002730 [Phytophthora ramorum]